MPKVIENYGPSRLVSTVHAVGEEIESPPIDQNHRGFRRWVLVNSFWRGEDTFLGKAIVCLWREEHLAI